MSSPFLDSVRHRLRVKHYSYSTEKSYPGWIRQFIRYHNMRHPRDLGKGHVEDFLTYLAVERNVAAATQNQALNVLLFMYREVLCVQLEWLDNVARAKKPTRLPVVLSKTEIMTLLSYLDGRHLLMAQLLYGAGLRLIECVHLRVQDVICVLRKCIRMCLTEVGVV